MNVAVSERRRRYKKGLWAEFAAEIFLMVKGYRVLERRYKTPVGEIDILAAKKRALVAVEVKARGDTQSALYAVTYKNRSRIERALSYYISRHPQWADKDVRFDVITIKLPFFIAHIDNAWRPRS